MKNGIEIKISISNYDEVIKQLEQIKKHLDDIRNYNVKINANVDFKELVDLLKKEQKNGKENIK